MTNCDLLRADKHVLDEQAQYTSTIGDLRALRVLAELGKEAIKIGCESEIKITVSDLTLQRVELAAQVRFPSPQLRHSSTELIDGHELLLECPDHTADRGGGLRERELYLFALPHGRVRVPG